MKHLSLPFICLSLLPSCGFAVTVALSPVQDATLFEDTNGTLAAGASLGFYTGRVGGKDATPLRRGLVKFDLSSIPVGATVTGVSIAMTVSKVSTTTAASVSLHQVTASWAEGTATTNGGLGGVRDGMDATWTHRDGTNDWATAGGDFIGISSATQSLAGVGLYTWTSSGLITDVQTWVDSPTTNNGWLVLGDEAVSQSVKLINSREASSGMPSLSVTYTLVPEPSSLILALTGFALYSGRKRR